MNNVRYYSIISISCMNYDFIKRDKTANYCVYQHGISKLTISYQFYAYIEIVCMFSQFPFET